MEDVDDDVDFEGRGSRWTFLEAPTSKPEVRGAPEQRRSHAHTNCPWRRRVERETDAEALVSLQREREGSAEAQQLGAIVPEIEVIFYGFELGLNVEREDRYLEIGPERKQEVAFGF